MAPATDWFQRPSQRLFGAYHMIALFNLDSIENSLDAFIKSCRKYNSKRNKVDVALVWI